LARMPVAKIITWQGYSLPSAVTLSTLPSPLTDWMGAFMTNLMPMSSRSFCMMSAMSLSAMRGMTWGIISMIVTSLPMLWRDTASSRPMTPAPPMTTLSAPLRADWMALPSLMVLTMNTFPRSAPGMGGTNTLPPVATTSES